MRSGLEPGTIELLQTSNIGLHSMLLYNIVIYTTNWEHALSQSLLQEMMVRFLISARTFTDPLPTPLGAKKGPQSRPKKNKLQNGGLFLLSSISLQSWNFQCFPKTSENAHLFQLLIRGLKPRSGSFDNTHIFKDS